MLNAKLFRQDLSVLVAAMQRRGVEFDAAAFEALEVKRKSLQESSQALKQQRNQISKSIGAAKSRGEDITGLMQQVAGIGDRLAEADQALTDVLAQQHDIKARLPNILSNEVPDGVSEDDNIELSRHGDIPQFDFEPQDHISLCSTNGSMDFSASATLSGSRFVVLHRDLARLHRALGQFMLDMHCQQHDYSEAYVPYLVKSDCLYGTGQLPNLRGDQFELAGERDLTLIPTAEVPLTNLCRDRIVSAEDLPLKYVALTPCFRSEAGSYGKDTAGMIRQHQFEKVEMVQMVSPDMAEEAFSALRSHAEAVLQALALPYRVMSLCAGDVGHASAKTHDLEVWLPGQSCYREISSCSHYGDYQARRMSARYRPAAGEKPQLLHTLNGSGLAVGRALIAVLENYQMADGRIRVPNVLSDYFPGKDTIGPF